MSDGATKPNEFVTKDSGVREEFAGGFVRDTDKGKLRFDLFPISMFKRLAGLYTRGIEKYGDENWKLARGRKAIERFKQSAYRHFIAWLEEDYEEDHGIAVAWNIFAYEWHRDRVTTLGGGDFNVGMHGEDLELLAHVKEENASKKRGQQNGNDTAEKA